MTVILHLSDIHYCSRKTADGSFYHDMVSRLPDTLVSLKQAIQDARAKLPHIDIAVITGDLTDDGSIEDYQAVKAVLEEELKGIPWLALPGNHDDIRMFHAVFDGTDCNEPLIDAHTIDGIAFFRFDNTEHGQENGVCVLQRLEQLDTLLKQAEETKKVILMHHPLIGIPGVPGMPEADRLAAILRDNGVCLVLAGHTHWSGSSSMQGIPCMTAPGLAFAAFNDPNQGVIFHEAHGFQAYELKEDSIHTMTDFTLGPVLAIHDTGSIIS